MGTPSPDASRTSGLRGPAMHRQSASITRRCPSVSTVTASTRSSPRASTTHVDVSSSTPASLSGAALNSRPTTRGDSSTTAATSTPASSRFAAISSPALSEPAITTRRPGRTPSRFSRACTSPDSVAPCNGSPGTSSHGSTDPVANTTIGARSRSSPPPPASASS